MVGFAGSMKRVFKDNNCKSSKKMESLVWRLKNSSGQSVSSSNNESYKWFSGEESFMMFDDLPAGDYTMYFSQGTPK